MVRKITAARRDASPYQMLKRVEGALPRAPEQHPTSPIFLTEGNEVHKGRGRAQL